MSLITQSDFIDLYLGEDFADVKGFSGIHGRIEAPTEWEPELISLRSRCLALYESTGEPEFSLVLNDIVLRVTLLVDLLNKPVFVLRKSNARVRDLETLGYSKEIYNALISPGLRGLVLICGEMSTGKTSSAASIMSARLSKLGGVGVAVEDPPETNLNGMHGVGRCIQIPVSRRTGGYEEALIRALRTGADIIMLGEVRDSATAAQVVRASINGHLIVATSHAGSIPQCIDRISALAQSEMTNANELMAQGLSLLIHQRLTSTTEGRQLKVNSLFIGPDASGIRQKIRSGNTVHVEQDISQQSMRSLWSEEL